MGVYVISMSDQPITQDPAPVAEVVIKGIVPPQLQRYQFQKGNKLSLGRPGKSKTELELIRRRILRVLKRRIFREKNLESVSTTELLRFFASISPKDQPGKMQAQINYISQIPRDGRQHLEQETVEITPVEKKDVPNGDSVESASPAV